MLPVLNKIYHPSWRVYRALREVPEIKPETYSLKSDADIFYPYETLDDLTLSLIQVLKCDPDYNDEIFNIVPCFSLFVDFDNRQPLECMLLGGTPTDRISDATGLTPEFIVTYSALFFDTTVIPNGRPGMISYISRGTYGRDAAAKKTFLSRGLDYTLIDKGVSPEKISIDSMMMSMMVQAFKLAKQKSESDERDDQMAAQSWASIMKQFASYFANAGKGKQGLTVEKLLLELKTEPPPQGVDSLD